MQGVISPSKPKVAVIGGGYWGRNLVRVFTELGSLAMICDTSFTTALYYLGIDTRLYRNTDQSPYLGTVTSSLDNVLAFDEIKGVAIATPNDTHYAIAKKCLLAGKDVFVEKPMTMNVKEAEDLVQLADDYQRVLMVGHIMLYHPAIVKLKELLLEPIQSIHTKRVSDSGNCVWNLGPHDVSIMLYLLDELPKKVSAQIVQDAAIINLGFSNAKGHILLGNSQIRKDRMIVIQGKEMEARFDDATKELATLKQGNIENIPFSPQEPLKLECQDFLHCVNTREKPKADGQNGLEVVKILCEASS